MLDRVAREVSRAKRRTEKEIRVDDSRRFPNRTSHRLPTASSNQDHSSFVLLFLEKENEFEDIKKLKKPPNKKPIEFEERIKEEEEEEEKTQLVVVVRNEALSLHFHIEPNIEQTIVATDFDLDIILFKKKTV